MISMIQPLAIGNALRVFLMPPAGTKRVIILRKVADNFTGYNDPNAFKVFDDDPQAAVLDSELLENAVTYYYRPYYWNGLVWSTAATMSGTPNPSYDDLSTDVLETVRDRLALGLRVEVARGTLSNDDGLIKVLNAPPLEQDTRWPVVTVHLQNEARGTSAIGEMIEPDDFVEADGTWGSIEGWLARVQLTIVGWCLNPDERITMRKALRRLVIGNFPVFDEAGMTQIEFSQQDMEELDRYSCPVYQVMCSFSCMAPVRVSSRDDAIVDVISNLVEG